MNLRTNIETPDEKIFLKKKYFGKYKGTFVKLRRKMRNMEKFYPDIYHYNGNVLNLWYTFELEETVDLNRLEFNEETLLWY